jgi:hypothetical protein
MKNSMVHSKVSTRCLVCAIVTFTIFACSSDAIAQSGIRQGSVCTVHFTSGAPMKFRIKTTGSEANIKTIINNVKDSVSWMVEVDGKTIVIPMANVRYIEISPALSTSRQPVIKGTSIK